MSLQPIVGNSPSFWNCHFLPIGTAIFTSARTTPLPLFWSGVMSWTMCSLRSRTAECRNLQNASHRYELSERIPTRA